MPADMTREPRRPWSFVFNLQVEYRSTTHHKSDMGKREQRLHSQSSKSGEAALREGVIGNTKHPHRVMGDVCDEDVYLTVDEHMIVCVLV